jgi:hypothetical protein
MPLEPLLALAPHSPPFFLCSSGLLCGLSLRSEFPVSGSSVAFAAALAIVQTVSQSRQASPPLSAIHSSPRIENGR